MRPWRRVIILIISVVLVLAAADCDAILPSDGDSVDEHNGRSPSVIEQDIFDLVNQARTDSGLEPLGGAGAISEVALEHSQYMESVGAISHDNFHDRATDLMGRIDASRVGENVAVGYPTPEAFVEGWMASEGHRENILNPSFHRTGIGYFESYVTQIFTD